MMKIIQTHGRFKGLPWYENLQSVSILGAGGIGSWLGLSLSRQGHQILIQDFDNVELHNLGGQLLAISDINKPKVNSVKNLINILSPENTKDFFTSKVRISGTSGTILPITFSCFDNMEARKIAFGRWVNVTRMQGNENKPCIFIDGRLLAEEFQVLVVKPTEEDIEKYRATIFEDNSIPDEDCTAKSTTHCSMMIASMMTSLFNNYITNYYSEFSIRDVPFFTRVSLPMMMFEFK